MVRAPLGLLAAAVVALPAASQTSPAGGSKPIPAAYPTREAAEKAARLHFHCTGAHRMGDVWMPCGSHNHGSGSAAGPH
ncbi:MAG: hypothetical protein VKI63_07455 [Cyanobium sp.]|jgi:hypothetical protein|nr:hypothetical protein [Cyanobium sp.]